MPDPLTLLAGALLLLGPVLQEDPAGRRVRHLDALRVERERELVELWETLQPPARRALESRVLAGRDPRAGRFQPIPLAVLARASRELMHPGDDGPLEPWFELVDSLDLRVVPGVFAAREGGRGEAMTVVLEGLWDSPVDQQRDTPAEVALVWRGPDGEERLARQEPADARSLEAGFEMYVRPPESGPAAWELLLEVRTAGGVVRTRGVRVECVAGLDAARAALAADPGAPGAADLAGRLRALEREGLRLAGADLVGPRLDALVGGRDGAPRALPPEPGASARTAYELGEERRDQEVVVVLPRRGEHPLDLLTGPVGRRWAGFAAERGARVRTADGEVGRDAAGLRALVRTLVAGGAGRVVVVARGDAGRLLPGALAREPLPELGGLVLAESPGAYAAVRPEVAVDTLRLEAEVAGGSLEELGAEGGPRRSRVGLGVSAPFDALATPERLAEWLDAE